MMDELYLPGPLYKHSLGHWSTTIEGLAQNVLKVTTHTLRRSEKLRSYNWFHVASRIELSVYVGSTTISLLSFS